MNKNIVFMGTPSIAGQILKSLYQNGYNIEAVYTQPPVASNRGQKIEKSPINLLAETLNLNIRTPNQLKKNKGNVSKTAEFIGMERSALHRKLKSLGIKGIN